MKIYFVCLYQRRLGTVLDVFWLLSQCQGQTIAHASDGQFFPPLQNRYAKKARIKEMKKQHRNTN